MAARYFIRVRARLFHTARIYGVMNPVLFVNVCEVIIYAAMTIQKISEKYYAVHP